MEEAVAALRDTVRLALAEAQEPGNEARPDALLADVAIDSEPIPALATDRGHSYFASARQDIGFLEALRTTRKPPSVEERSRLAAMLRWAVRELGEWRLEDDVRRQKLVALFVFTRCCNPDGDFWYQFPPGLEQNANLLGELARLIAGWRIDLAIPGYSRNPISEGEAIERFRVADAAGDWATIANEWRQYESFVFVSQHVFYLEVIPCLQRFGYPQLLKSLSGIRQIILVVQFLSALTVKQSLALALDSDNAYVRFGAALAALPRNRKVSLDSAEEKLLTDLLVKVASETDQWARWMLAFNRFPMYYPAIQVSLGKALAAIPQTGIAAYADAVVLTTLGGNGREAVATCLREFRSAATLDRRQELWRRAYECWSKWNFDSATAHRTPPPRKLLGTRLRDCRLCAGMPFRRGTRHIYK